MPKAIPREVANTLSQNTGVRRSRSEEKNINISSKGTKVADHIATNKSRRRYGVKAGSIPEIVKGALDFIDVSGVCLRASILNMLDDYIR